MSEEQQWVVFGLGAEDYGVPITAVQEIIKPQVVTGVPETPEYMEGVVNLRGRILPIFNLRRRFLLPDVETTKATRIIVVEDEEGNAGLIVDGVSEVLTIPAGSIAPPPTGAGKVAGSYIKAVARLEERLVLLLDLSQVLARLGQEAI